MFKIINTTALISALVFAVFAILTVSGNLDMLNNSLMNAVYSLESPVLTIAMKIISTISEWFVFIPITLVLLIIPNIRWKAGLPVAITLATSGTLNWILKQLFAVPRPDTHRLIVETGYSFPSGHAMNGAAFIGICVLLFVRYSANRKSKTIASILATFFILAIGFSRVYLGVHTPADIVAGYVMGLLLCLLTLSVLDKIQRPAKIFT